MYGSVPPVIEGFTFPVDGLPEGARTRAVCGVSSGDPPLSITWLKDGAGIPHDLPVNISTLDMYSSLLSISALESAHSGEYTCVASNPASEARYSSKLQVKGKPLLRILVESCLEGIGSICEVQWLAKIFNFFTI